MNFLNTISLRTMLWLVPVFFMLHNMEEAPFMEQWSKRLPIKIHPTVTTSQFVIAVVFLTVTGFIVTFASLTWLPTSTGYLLILSMQAVLFVNAFVPHLLATLRFRLYSPGVVTAVLITIPFSIYLFQRALREQVLSWSQFWLLLGIAPFVMVLFAFLSLQIGKLVTRRNSSSI